MKHSMVVLFQTKRGLLLLAQSSLVAFGILSGFAQIVLAIWPNPHLSSNERWFLLAALLVASLVFGLSRTWPRSGADRSFDSPDITVSIVVGDLFDQQTHLVVGFNDVFDTDTTDSVIIAASSVQGQFLQRIYGGDRGKLDADISDSLAGVQISEAEDRANKSAGKLERYPMGTVAVLGAPNRHYFCVAYTKMQNNLIAQSDVDLLWRSLSEVWESVYLRGQQKAVSIPIVGSELARINCLDRESLLRMILLSFVARSRQGIFCKELRIVVHPKDFDQLNMLEVAAFLRTL
ncbi:DUF6430 domain-containing protein [Actinocorallia sp. API 0066]|uniref:macro domain-containing protein n=1 Tax=Actinocorallia sp. API 0066 TaxID=2896846 RepID=UPI001E420D00|nr:macro domain-containing protein [Actinocorallia sp. API 0066]MCD0448316.1 DUF6430 domain-containing protein [Actinocorallia sp. API 0066]